jgi:glycogen synthase
MLDECSSYVISFHFDINQADQYKYRGIQNKCDTSICLYSHKQYIYNDVISTNHQKITHLYIQKATGYGLDGPGIESR